jgi:hypothetical protein
MIDKADFYHGAALIRIIEDGRCENVTSHASGYLVNGRVAVCVKYTTKTGSPWRFTLTADEISACEHAVREVGRCVVAFVCGGDGICAVPWQQISGLIGEAPAWIASRRAFNGCYAVSAANGTLARKIARNQWPDVVFLRGDDD